MTSSARVAHERTEDLGVMPILKKFETYMYALRKGWVCITIEGRDLQACKSDLWLGHNGIPGEMD